MAVSVIKQPSLVTPGRNPVRWIFQTNNYVITPGVKAVNRFTISGGVGIGQTIDFKYGEVEFTLLVTGVDDGYNIPIGAYGIAYMGVILLALQQNYYLDRDFEITLSGSGPFTFTFTAREVGSKYNMNNSTDTLPNGSFSFPVAGVDYQTRENFKIGVDVYVEDVYGSNNFKRLGTKYFDPDDNSKVDIDIRNELHAYLQREYNFPSYNQTVYAPCTNINKRWYIKYFEYYNSKNYKKVTTSMMRVIKGGIHRNFWPAVADDFRLLWIGNPLANNLMKFLITRRATRTATLKQQEYLYLVTSGAISNARLRAKVNYSNNTSTTTTIATYASLGGQNTYMFPAGFMQLNLGALNPALTPVSWGIYIDNTSGALKSEYILYNIVDEGYYNRYFLFENSMGAVETLRTEGYKTINADTDKSEFVGLLDNGYTAEDAEITSTTTDVAQAFEVYTGHYFLKEEALDLIDMLRSEKMFELQPDLNPFGFVPTGKKIPVTVDKGSFALVTDDNFAYGVKFIYRPAFKELNQTWR